LSRGRHIFQEKLEILEVFLILLTELRWFSYNGEALGFMRCFLVVDPTNPKAPRF
jgi:hypothetical protein